MSLPFLALITNVNVFVIFTSKGVPTKLLFSILKPPGILPLITVKLSTLFTDGYSLC